LATGELVFLTGPPRGKSTLLRLIALLERPTWRRIEMNGQDLARVGRAGFRRTGGRSAWCSRTAPAERPTGV